MSQNYESIPKDWKLALTDSQEDDKDEEISEEWKEEAD
jgi:hypothetical protein